MDKVNGKSNELIPLAQLDGCINTYSGKKFSLFNPTPEMVDIEDIARGLAYKAHFGGQSPEFFSIAQHSLIVCRKMEEYGIVDPDLLLLGLLHDASEAYIGDMIKPLKVHLPLFCEVENKIMNTICEKFRLDYNKLYFIKQFDVQTQMMEYEQFYKGKNNFRCLTPMVALTSFRQRVFYFLTKLTIHETVD